MKNQTLKFTLVSLFMGLTTLAVAQNNITILSCTERQDESCRNVPMINPAFTHTTFDYSGDMNNNAILTASVKDEDGQAVSNISVDAVKASASTINFNITVINGDVEPGDYVLDMVVTDPDGATSATTGCGYFNNSNPTKARFVMGTFKVFGEVYDNNLLNSQSIADGGSATFNEVFGEADLNCGYSWTIAGTRMNEMIGGQGADSTFTIDIGTGRTVDARCRTLDLGNNTTFVEVKLTDHNNGPNGTFTIKVEAIGACGRSESSAATAFVLPVELAFFDAKPETNGVKLRWRTLSELNNEGFDVERSTDGKTFEKIGFIEGQGTTLEVIDYEFIDEDAFNGLSYYRLKQMDFEQAGNDAAFEYSNVVSVNLKNTLDDNINIYPTASATQVQIVFGETLEEDMMVEVYDAMGRMLMNTAIRNGNNQQDLDITSFGKGQYFVKLYNEGSSTTKTFFKL